MRTALIASLALAIAAPALAADGSVQIQTSDLDLSTPADQHRLDARVERAARRLCDSGMRNLAAITAENRCIAAALLSVAPQTTRAIALAQGTRRLAQSGAPVAG